MAVITLRLLVGSPEVADSMFYLFDTDDSIHDVQRRINCLSRTINAQNRTPTKITPESDLHRGVVGLRITNAPPTYAVYL